MIHVPEDMTATVAADLTLAALQSALTPARQWLPLDPPDPTHTLREILNRNESGPRLYGYGTVREYVIGLKVRLADGRMVKTGGQVVKNVAGYDLQKLFIGSGGALATAVEVTFKLRPLPENERFVLQQFETLEQAGAAVETVAASDLSPIVFDLYRAPERGLPPAATSLPQSAPKPPEGRASFTLVLGFDGAKEDVEWQLTTAEKLGFHDPATLNYEREFRAGDPPHKLSVAPSKLIEAVRTLGAAPFVARAGNGIIFHRVASAATSPSASAAVLQLERRLKNEFDPKHQLPALR